MWPRRNSYKLYNNIFRLIGRIKKMNNDKYENNYQTNVQTSEIRYSRTIDSFEILSPLGEGTFGCVDDSKLKLFNYWIV